MKIKISALVGVLAAGAVTLAFQASAQACATVYEHIDYGGASMYVRDGEHTSYVGGPWNDQISSVKVEPGCTINVWEHAGYRGRHESLSGEVVWIGDGWNDIVSSYICTCR